MNEREKIYQDVAGLHMAQSVNNQNYPSAWHDGVDAALVVIREGGTASGVLPKAYPPRHARYLLKRGEFTFTATPCYGMHEPWWVVRTLSGEAEPEPMKDGDAWSAL